MRRPIIVLILVAGAFAAAPAMAQQGNGLYEPFPNPTHEHSNAFFRPLSLRVTPSGLKRGAFAFGLHRAPGPSGPSARAGIDSGSKQPLGLLAALGAAAVALAAGGLARRRSAGPAGAPA